MTTSSLRLENSLLKGVGKDSMLIPFVGRFAPSPTGNLHLGSLTTAVASYCHIKSLAHSHRPPSHQSKTNVQMDSKQGIPQWRLRIEDVDTQRCKPEYTKRILEDLTALGLHWDGEVVYQSQRTSIYNDYIDDVLKPYVYACQCSRKDLINQRIYPKYCLGKNLNQKTNKLRIQLPNQDINFIDGLIGQQCQNPQQSLGDMVIRRDCNSLSMINYILAVSIDDGLQNVTHVMRGLDILPMTSAQISIMQMAQLPQINHWYHLPLVLNQRGQKLSKQNLATPIDTSSERKCSELLSIALKFLSQPPVDIDTPTRMLYQASMQWRNEPFIHSDNEPLSPTN